MRRSRSSLAFLIGCIKKQVNPRRKRCAAVVTLFVPYYFYPMKFPALKISENRDGPLREVSIEAWQWLYWQEESAKFAAVARRSRSICVRHFAAIIRGDKSLSVPFHFAKFAQFSETRRDGDTVTRDDDRLYVDFHLNTLAWNLTAVEFLFHLSPYYEM